MADVDNIDVEDPRIQNRLEEVKEEIRKEIRKEFRVKEGIENMLKVLSLVCILNLCSFQYPCFQLALLCQNKRIVTGINLHSLVLSLPVTYLKYDIPVIFILN